jgi:hypothetical protein
MSWYEFIGKKFKAVFSAIDNVNRSHAVDTAAIEVQELQHIFALLVLGHAVGLPAPPADLTLQLLPEMEEEFRLLLNRIDTAQAPLSMLYSSLSVD